MTDRTPTIADEPAPPEAPAEPVGLTEAAAVEPPTIADHAIEVAAASTAKGAKVDLAPVRALLVDLEYSAKHNAEPACPVCKCFRPLDPANPREWERHAEDCRFAAALALVS